VACIHETRWKGSSYKFLETERKIHKPFLIGSEEGSDSVGIFIAENWVDSVVSVKRHSKRVLILKMLLDTHTHTHTHTHNRFTALLEYVRDHPGELVPER